MTNIAKNISINVAINVAKSISKAVTGFFARYWNTTTDFVNGLLKDTTGNGYDFTSPYTKE